MDSVQPARPACPLPKPPTHNTTLSPSLTAVEVARPERFFAFSRAVGVRWPPGGPPWPACQQGRQFGRLPRGQADDLPSFPNSEINRSPYSTRGRFATVRPKGGNGHFRVMPPCWGGRPSPRCTNIGFGPQGPRSRPVAAIGHHGVPCFSAYRQPSGGSKMGLAVTSGGR